MTRDWLRFGVVVSVYEQGVTRGWLRLGGGGGDEQGRGAGQLLVSAAAPLTSIVLTWVLAEICMSVRRAGRVRGRRGTAERVLSPAGPKSVAPVSRPETIAIAECIRCSMKGLAITI